MENFRVEDQDYFPQNTSILGNFGMSTVLLKTAFNQSKSSVSTNFKKFREFRSIIAHRLVESTIFSSLGDDKEGYPLGFGKNQQSVLLHSFVAAYSGSDPNRIELNPIKNTPLPNWDLKFTGLTEIKSIAKIFKRLSKAQRCASLLGLSFRGVVLGGGRLGAPQGLLFGNLCVLVRFFPLPKVSERAR